MATKTSNSSTKKTYSYLGPVVTFTELALAQVPEAKGAKWHPVANVQEAIDNILSGHSARAVIPIENSIEGGVSATLDALAASEGIHIFGEYLVPVSFNLVARPGVALKDVVTVATHPVAYAQTHKWLAANLAGHSYLPATSTAAAAGGKVNRTWLQSFDLADLNSPLPMSGRTNHHSYGTGVGAANLVVLTDVLRNDDQARCMALRVAECVRLGAWVILGDAASSCRQTFLDLLEVELRFVDCGHPSFDKPFLIEQPSLGWASEPVQLLRLNSPGFAPALASGYRSLEERRGYKLPPPVVEVLESARESAGREGGREIVSPNLLL
jgi:hypothetical protein